MEPQTHARAIIDYAQNDDGVEMRNALYSAIQDKVMAHIEAKKQELAQSLIVPKQDAQETETEEPETVETTEVENA